MVREKIALGQRIQARLNMHIQPASGKQANGGEQSGK
jgi:hypothetical protein